MTTTQQPNPTRRRAVALATLVLSLAACSAKERTDLVLVDVDLTEVPSATSLSMSLLAATTQAPLKQQTVATPALANGVAKIGLGQTAGMTGDIVVQVVALGQGGAILGQGMSVPVTVVPGKNAGPVAVKVKKTDGVPEPVDSGTPDSLGYDLGAPIDGGAPGVDSGTTTGGDVQPGLGDAAPDGLPSDGRTDAATDAPTDTPTFTDLLPDAPPLPDGAADSAEVRADVPADVTTTPDASNILGTLASCKKYVHYPDSPATCPAGSDQQDVIVSTTALTPDNKYLVTGANNSWVKIWKVVDTGLEDTQIVLTGESYRVSATISPAGDILAMPSPTGNVALYDLPQTIAQGSGIQVGTLEGSKLKKAAEWDYHQAFFTTDGKQVVVIYTGVDALVQGGGNVGVWELGTRTLLRELPFENGTRAYTVANSPSTGPVWVVMGKIETVTNDAGTYDQTTVTLRDTSATVTATPSFVVPSQVYRAAFSADQRVLAIGTNDGEISLWDLSTLNNIQRLGSPLVAGGSRDSVYGLAFSSDGQFLTAGSSVYDGAKSLWIINLQSRSVVKRDISWSPRAFAFAADHTTWAYGLGGCGFLYFCK